MSETETKTEAEEIEKAEAEDQDQGEVQESREIPVQESGPFKRDLPDVHRHDLKPEDITALSVLMEKGKIQATAENLSLLIRALEGQDVGDQDKISRLTNPKNILERSRYPTYTQLHLVVYLKMIFQKNKHAIACGTWADTLSEALISYKGQGRIEYVDMVKAANPVVPEQVFSLNRPGQAPEETQKRHFWNRRVKSNEPEETME